MLMVSTSYPADLEDWRGLFIRHLTDAFTRRADIRLRLWSPPGAMPANAAYVATPDEEHWLAALMKSGGIAHLMRTQRLRGLAAPLHLLRILRRLYLREQEVDVLHVNWLQNALMLPRNGIPLLTTVLGTDMQLLRLPGMTGLLRRAFRGRRVAICPNAEWMVPELERRFGGVARIRFVPFGIEPRWFALERTPAQPSRWLCVSRLTQGKIGTLFSWGERYFASGTRELHLFGPMQQAIAVPDWVHYHGPATPESLCSEWFVQASGLITLSQHAEGRPQVMLEAMASALPIIASRIAAHEDLLQHAQTGWLCGDESELGSALDTLDQVDANRALGLRARAWAHDMVGNWDDCAARYAHIYRELVHP
jgi:glycosyltransferase involved in cell wall biosynthesis